MTKHEDRKGIRLQKMLARAGIASRRKSEELVFEGRVKVNGKTVTEAGIRVDADRDRVEVDGKDIRIEKNAYYILNKPPGVVTTMKDPEGRPSVAELIRDLPERVFPVGRLDYDAEGLLFITNDGELANRLMHPRYGVKRTYDAKISGSPSEASLDHLRKGVRLSDGYVRPLSLRIVGKAKRNTWVRIEVREGRNHLIKRIFEAGGYRVQRLRRIEIAGIDLGDLSVGSIRPLSGNEVLLLRDTLNNSSEKRIRRKEN